MYIGTIHLNISYRFATHRGPLEQPVFAIQIPAAYFETAMHNYLLSIVEPRINEHKSHSNTPPRIYHYFELTPEQMSKFVLVFPSFPL